MVAEDVKKHVWVYITIFASLALLTILTVAVASVDMAVGLAIGVGMTIAIVKGSLVLSFFMHLASEKRLIILLLTITVIFFFALILLPLGDSLNTIGTPYVP